ncbi:MAG: hypothetical protein PHE02_06250 [Lachnospiraceae bacterium]|nr:hypothetical protein [Lachnospiraceae bacterium]
MAMKVSGNYANNYLEKVQAGQNKTNEADKVQRSEDKMKSNLTPQDAYISSEKSGSKPTGLYHLGQDENGNPKVLYDDPKKAEKVKAAPEKKAEECTTNTDGVDREIEKLKEEKKQLQQQIRSAAEDEEKVKDLKNKLSQIEGEISQKDNDAYRRQNAIIS